MERYYIYCSNNQAYHALINNSITAKSIMPDDFKSDTASFFSNQYIFLTKDSLCDEIRCLGISDAYYPVALEIIDISEGSSIPAKLLTLTKDGKVVLSEETALSDYNNTEGCLGAFVLGEIPISFLSGIIFDDCDQRAGFKKSSLDLWFPEELFAEWSEKEVKESSLTDEIMHIASERVDDTLDEQVYREIINLVNNRLRIKAASYFAIDGTEDWSIGSIKTNIDEALLRYLDGEEASLRDIVKKLLKKIETSDEEGYKAFLGAKDKVFDPSDEGINKRIFDHIITVILQDTDIRERVSEDAFNSIGTFCLDIAGEKTDEMKNALGTLIGFLKSNMDPDEALEAMGNYDVLRSFMMFIDQQETADFMRRACTKLSQEEKRYTYIMYGTLNGMAEVERGQKANRPLEYRLEALVCRHYSNPHIVSRLLPISESVFLQKPSDEIKKDSAYGFTPSVSIWFDCTTSQQRLLTSASDKDLEAVYKLMAKTSRDDPIPEQDVYAFKTPIMIAVQIDGKEIQTYEIRHKKDAKDFGKKIENLVKKEREVFIADNFKKYLSDEKRYRKFYKKYAEKVQSMCGKA